MIETSQLSTDRHFAKGLGSEFRYRYFLTLFLPGYTEWESSDFSKASKCLEFTHGLFTYGN